MDKTLLILGAGASKDFCNIFPTGTELIKEINYHFITEKKFPDATNVNSWYLSALMNDLSRVFGQQEFLFREIKNHLWRVQLNYESEQLREQAQQPTSIDHFISSEISAGNLSDTAKDVILYTIYYLIKGTEYAYEGRKEQFQNSWVYKLATKLFEYDNKAINDCLSVVTFNYDRTFEQYFEKSINSLRQNSTDIYTTNNNIHHCYGSLGSLNDISFGLANDEVEIIKRHYRNIKLVDQRATKPMEMSDAHEYKFVHFIGFGFDKTNMSLLNINQFTSATFTGTGYGLSQNEIDEIDNKYRVALAYKKCGEYIREIQLN